MTLQEQINDVALILEQAVYEKTACRNPKKKRAAERASIFWADILNSLNELQSMKLGKHELH